MQVGAQRAGRRGGYYGGIDRPGIAVRTGDRILAGARIHGAGVGQDLEHLRHIVLDVNRAAQALRADRLKHHAETDHVAGAYIRVGYRLVNAKTWQVGLGIGYITADVYGVRHAARIGVMGVKIDRPPARVATHVRLWEYLEL